ncbi:MAG: RIP metalloprotease RseP [Patescibacteria group bacterium]
MDIFLTVIAVIVIFSVLVLLHELGHFVMARRAGIKVLEFGFGFPPKLFSYKKGDTVYSFNLIPIGGFVRLYGEDAQEPGALNSKYSFVHKTPWQRATVAVAGVVMNFLLAFVLLVFGFSFGIQPLLVDESDLFSNIENGNIVIEAGAFVDKVAPDSSAARAGILPGDQLLKVAGIEVIDASFIDNVRDVHDTGATFMFRRGDKEMTFELTAPGEGADFGLEFKQNTDFSRPVIHTVSGDSIGAAAGLKSGDAILRVDGKEMYMPEDVSSALLGSSEPIITVHRGSRTLDVKLLYPMQNRVLIVDVFPGRAAEGGMVAGDEVVSINGTKVTHPVEAQEAIRAHAGREGIYRVMRNGSEVNLSITPAEEGTIGVLLSPIVAIRGSEFSLYSGTVLTSLVEIRDIKLGFPQSIGAAYHETVRLTGLTVAAFGRTMKGLISKLEVPEDIGGPVQIAVYTHTFVKEGFMALIRFAAVLSLSLAVINILPIPALDGGRLFFIIIEAVSGKKISPRIESRIHSLGFVLLILLIILVTYSDISKIL